jgi:hypothetical protein
LFGMEEWDPVQQEATMSSMNRRSWKEAMKMFEQPSG